MGLANNTDDIGQQASVVGNYCVLCLGNHVIFICLYHKFII